MKKLVENIFYLGISEKNPLPNFGWLIDVWCMTCNIIASLSINKIRATKGGKAAKAATGFWEKENGSESGGSSGSGSAHLFGKCLA